MVKVQLGTAIGAVSVMGPGSESPQKAAAAVQAKELAAQKTRVESLCQALSKAIQTAETYGHNLFVSHREQLIHLAVQIASRILARDIAKGDYQIDQILTQAIQQTASGPILEIRLNPDDLKTYEEILKNGQGSIGQDVKITPDWSVGQAECVVETPQGTMECRIQDHLRQIETALNNVS